LREAGSISKKKHRVWAHLRQLLPRNRTCQSIQQHAIRKLAPKAQYYKMEENLSPKDLVNKKLGIQGTEY